VKQQSSVTLGLPLAWEGEALEILKRYERKYAYRLPAGELRSRALQKLAKATVTCPAHLAALLNVIVRQVLVDYGKEQSRHYRKHVYDYAADWPSPAEELAPLLQDRMEGLFDPHGPLDDDERKLLQTMLEDPVHFMNQDGFPNQSALAGHFQKSHTTIGRRWQKILRKVEAWRQGQMDLSL
jgi:hypothetical protein